MKFLSIPNSTCQWLLSQPSALDALISDMHMISDSLELTDRTLAIGPIRIAKCPKDQLIVYWNTDHWPDTGIESLCFIKLDGTKGAFEHEDLEGPCLQTEIIVAAHRLGRRNIPTTFFNELHVKGNTCALRGANREGRIGYFEHLVRWKGIELNTVLLVGPAPNLDNFAASNDHLRITIGRNRRYIEGFVNTVSEVFASANRRAELDHTEFEALIEVHKPARDMRDVLGKGLAFQLKTVGQGFADEGLSFDQWVEKDSQLDETKRLLLSADLSDRLPLRILGAAGSGKSLLMQLLAMQVLKRSESDGKECYILFLTHNKGMQEQLWLRFVDLGAEKYLDGDAQKLIVETLMSFAKTELNLKENEMFSEDAKVMSDIQLDFVAEFLADRLDKVQDLNDAGKWPVFSCFNSAGDAKKILSHLIADEIGEVIKGRGLRESQADYILSEQALSLLHREMNEKEREIVFDVFRAYDAEVRERSGYLDLDDIAVSVHGQLNVPVRRMRRTKEGCDYLFVDEAQLFLTNERRVFSLLTKKEGGNLPIIIALDNAQNLKATVSRTGFGLLGMSSITDEMLPSVHRSTPEIVALAFYVIQRCTNLFGRDFPDFTESSSSAIGKCATRKQLPTLTKPQDPNTSIDDWVVEITKKLRSQNCRTIAVSCLADTYEDRVVDRLRKEFRKVFTEMKVRGTPAKKKGPQIPQIVYSRPELIGGRQFDAVIAVGLEHGLVPPRVNSVSLRAALEEIAFRQMYLVFSRAREHLYIVNSCKSAPANVIQLAIDDGLIARE